MFSYKTGTKGFGLLIPLMVIAVIGLGAVVADRVTTKEAEVAAPNAEAVVESGDETFLEALFSGPTTKEEESSSGETEEGMHDDATLSDSGQRAVITLAGGCFWCTEAYLQETAGVVDAVSGYAGGSKDTASYQQVSKGTTGHREAVQVTYDPARISFDGILDVYWSHIDPTDSGGQFADRGFQYTTAIFYHTEEQKSVAERSRAALEASGLFDEPVVTQILPYVNFFKAEEYHQDFYKKSSAHYERYKKASGRSGFIDENWAKEAALLFLEQEQTENVGMSSSRYIEHEWTDAEIEAGLSALPPDVYHIVAEEGTEQAYNNAYWDHKEEGIYVDVVTGRPLFSSTHKYDSKTGWPSFYRPIDEGSLILEDDYTLAIPRIEVRSESGHLGHLFSDGPQEHGGKRYCINSLALNFVSRSEMETRGYGDYLYLFES